MILLDTNVISAFTTPFPDLATERWLNDQEDDEIWTTAINVYEVRAGIDRLPIGKRRSIIESSWTALLHVVIADRVMPLDADSAELAGALLASRIRAGFTDDHRDIQIAGIALANGAVVATRNVRHFMALGVPIINPWETG